MRRVGFQMQVKKDRIAEYKEVGFNKFRQVWVSRLLVCAALTRHGWHRYSLFMNADGLVFGYFETDTDFATALDGFLSEEATQRWGEANEGLVEIPEGGPKYALIELEEVFHLD